MLPRVIVQHRVHARASSFSSLLCSKIDQLTMARPLDRILRSETSERDSSSWNERRADSCKRARQTFFSFSPVNRIHAVLSLPIDHWNLQQPPCDSIDLAHSIISIIVQARSTWISIYFTLNTSIYIIDILYINKQICSVILIKCIHVQLIVSRLIVDLNSLISILYRQYRYVHRILFQQYDKTSTLYNFKIIIISKE